MDWVRTDPSAAVETWTRGTKLPPGPVMMSSLPSPLTSAHATDTPPVGRVPQNDVDGFVVFRRRVVDDRDGHGGGGLSAGEGNGLGNGGVVGVRRGRAGGRGEIDGDDTQRLSGADDVDGSRAAAFGN